MCAAIDGALKYIAGTKYILHWNLLVTEQEQGTKTFCFSGRFRFLQVLEVQTAGGVEIKDRFCLRQISLYYDCFPGYDFLASADKRGEK